MLLRRYLTHNSRSRWLLLPRWLIFLGCCLSNASDEFPITNWKTASPESQGLDSAVLAEALDYVRVNAIPLHSFLIVRNGVIVLEA